MCPLTGGIARGTAGQCGAPAFVESIGFGVLR